MVLLAQLSCTHYTLNYMSATILCIKLLSNAYFILYEPNITRNKAFFGMMQKISALQVLCSNSNVHQIHDPCNYSDNGLLFSTLLGRRDGVGGTVCYVFISLSVYMFGLFESLETYCLVFDSNTMDIVHEIAQYYLKYQYQGM